MKQLLIAFFIPLFLFSCKKKDEEVPASVTSNNTWVKVTTYPNELSDPFLFSRDTFIATNSLFEQPIFYKSNDYGVTWTSVPSTINGYIHEVITHEGDLYALTRFDGVYRSTDLCRNWVEINNGLPDGTFNDIVSSDKGLFVCARQGLYFSNDKGDTWKEIYISKNDVIVETVGFVGNVLIASFANYRDGSYGLCRSLDNGATWTYTGIVRDLYIRKISTYNNVVFALGKDLHVSFDAGATWLKGQGLDVFGVNDCITIEFYNGKAYVASNYGVFVSEDYGLHWVCDRKDGYVSRMARRDNELYTLSLFGRMWKTTLK